MADQPQKQSDNFSKKPPELNPQAPQRKFEKNPPL